MSDGGGVRGLSSLLLLAETMSRLNGLVESDGPLKPVDYFDIIAGTGTGGYVGAESRSPPDDEAICRVSACMLGRLALSMDQAIAAYVKLVEKVFSDKKVIGTSGPSEYKGSKLREALKSMVRDVTGNENERMKGEQQENGSKT